MAAVINSDSLQRNKDGNMTSLTSTSLQYMCIFFTMSGITLIRSVPSP